MKILNAKIVILLLTLVMTGKAKAQDWANINKYQNDNSVLIATKTEGNRIVFFGDSITEGWGVTCSDFFIGKNYVNRGISGQTTSQMVVRFRPDVIALKPKIVVILAGTNDIAGNTGPITLENILGNLISMCELAKANNIKVVLCSILPAYEYSWKPEIKPAEAIITLNTSIQKYAAKNGIEYVDYFSAMVDERKGLKAIYSNDGVHPTKEGYLVMGPIVDKTILKISK
jgi:lysophospholipase L1-like esterase